MTAPALARYLAAEDYIRAADHLRVLRIAERLTGRPFITPTDRRDVMSAERTLSALL